MFGLILIPVDATAIAARVVPFASLLARTLTQPMLLLSVQTAVPEEDMVQLTRNGDGALAALREHQHAFASAYLEHARTQLADEGTSCRTLIAEGDPAEQIVAVAEAEQAGLIVMATHGRTGLARWFMGSVADRVLRTAQIPVVFLRPVVDDATPDRVRSVLVPLDGELLAEEVLPTAVELAKAFGVGITLLRTQRLTWAMSTPGATLSAELISALEEAAKVYLDEKVGWCRAHGVDAKPHFALYADPATEIDEVAQRSGALVVMATHARAGLERTFVGSVTDKVVRTTSSPVMVIRPAH